jgi:hypothetical protein
LARRLILGGLATLTFPGESFKADEDGQRGGVASNLLGTTPSSATGGGVLT